MTKEQQLFDLAFEIAHENNVTLPREVLFMKGTTNPPTIFIAAAGDIAEELEEFLRSKTNMTLEQTGYWGTKQ